MNVGSLQQIPAEHDHERKELNRKLDQRRYNNRQGGDQAWKIDLAEQIGIVFERCGGLRQAGGKVVPWCRARQIEQYGRQPVRGHPGHATEDKSEGERGEQRLDEEPDGPQDGLLVNRDEVPPDKHPEEVAVAPQIRQVQFKPPGARSDDEIPVLPRD